MENNCAYLVTEANYQTVVTNFRIIYISNLLMCVKVLIHFLLILRFLLLVPSLHSLWSGWFFFFLPQSSFVPLARICS